MLSPKELRSIQKEVVHTQDRLPLIFSALSDAGRFRIFKVLLERNDVCVTDIANILGTSVPAASQQLRVMELSGIVQGVRSGQKMCYHIKNDDPLVKSVISIINS